MFRCCFTLQQLHVKTLFIRFVTVGDPEDEASHEKSHNGIVDRLKFPGWKNERNCGEFENGRIVMIQPGDPKHMWRKVQDALTVVDR